MVTKDAWGTDRGSKPDIGAHEMKTDGVSNPAATPDKPVVKPVVPEPIVEPIVELPKNPVNICDKCPLAKITLSEGVVVKIKTSISFELKNG
jgi:hypothetical protein